MTPRERIQRLQGALPNAVLVHWAATGDPAEVKRTRPSAARILIDQPEVYNALCAVLALRELEAGESLDYWTYVSLADWERRALDGR